MKKGIAAVCLSLLLTALSSLGAGENLILVKDGNPGSTRIQMSYDPSAQEFQAAKELNHYIRKISGAHVPWQVQAPAFQRVLGKDPDFTEITLATLENGKAHTVTCEVENTGSTAGHATVQLYIQGVSGTIVRRVRELKAFEKVYLQPGEKKTVELKLDCDALSIWNRKMQFAPEESKVELYVEESGSKVWNGELKITK